MRNWMYEKLFPHAGHQIECVTYGDPDEPHDVCVECISCGCVLVSVEDFEEADNTSVASLTITINC